MLLLHRLADVSLKSTNPISRAEHLESSESGEAGFEHTRLKSPNFGKMRSKKKGCGGLVIPKNVSYFLVNILGEYREMPTNIESIPLCSGGV